MRKATRRTKEEEKAVLALLERKGNRSWREVAKDVDLCGLFKPGTLSSIAKGDYFPTDPTLRELLGVGPKVCETCRQKITRPRKVKLWRRLEDLKPQELLYLLNNRTEKF